MGCGREEPIAHWKRGSAKICDGTGVRFDARIKPMAKDEVMMPMMKMMQMLEMKQTPDASGPNARGWQRQMQRLGMVGRSDLLESPPVVTSNLVVAVRLRLARLAQGRIVDVLDVVHLQGTASDRRLDIIASERWVLHRAKRPSAPKQSVTCREERESVL